MRKTLTTLALAGAIALGTAGPASASEWMSKRCAVAAVTTGLLAAMCAGPSDDPEPVAPRDSYSTFEDGNGEGKG